MSWPRCHLLSFAVAACTPAAPPTVVVLDGTTMGSTWCVKYVGAVAPEGVRVWVEQLLAVYDTTFSNWRADSEIVRCNRHRSTAPWPASPRFCAVLQQALDLARATDGAFDPTVAPLSEVFRAAKHSGVLDDTALAAAATHVGWTRLRVAEGALHKLDPEVRLDLDGIVAGACCDELAEVLAAHGLHDFLLDITGEFLARGMKAKGQPWLVSVVDPAQAVPGHERALTTLPLRSQALCTSGDYRNFVQAGGRHWHHIFDPRTGRNPDNHVVEAAVLAPSAALADGLGTAFMVLGVDGATKVLERAAPGQRVGVLFVQGCSDGSLAVAKVGWPE
ncbi:MAG TPA: FAD:protein FMN transferase [Planctomycetota bacterium]|nr:FAD:protein FMN transferase [Planctomycetota bacterium]